MAEPNWTNRTMWTGDNLDIMRGMNSESVDLIYLDPPFNSNRNYSAPIGSEAAGAAFKDTWTLDDVDEAWHGEIAEQHPALYAIIGAARQAHGTGMQSYLIMMGVRLLEMRRLLKPTGSLYLHCDPTASHYLKLLMDAVFGQGNFRNEITWQRVTSTQKGSQHTSKRWGNNGDMLLYYATSAAATLDSLRPPSEMSAEEIAKKFKHVDENGERYYDDSAHIWRTPNMGARPNLCYEWRGYVNPHPSGWRLSEQRLEEEYKKGNIVILENGKLQRRKYLRDYKGASYGNIWTDIPMALGKERVGYPTQKPLTLLERIIRASSNEGDIVLDPFCGCATACVATDRLNRQWAGIDLSPLAARLVRSRIQAEGPLLYDLTHRTDIPRRTDVGKVPPYRTQKHTLFGRQEGVCNGCRIAFPFRNFTVDHVVPRSKGGTDHLDNLQLLCAACNSVKGAGSQAELIAALKRQGIT
ncbi:MAG: DNA methyltransferase [bacterium]|nr:DNA methyltransferase [bacterium]